MARTSTPFDRHYVSSSARGTRPDTCPGPKTPLAKVRGLPPPGSNAAVRSAVSQPSTEPITVQRRASNTGVLMVAGQEVAVGRQFQHHAVTVHVSETTLGIEFPDGDTKVVRRTTDQAVRSIKGHRPRTAASPAS